MKNIKNTTCEELLYQLEDKFSKKDIRRTKRNYHDSLKVINRKKLDKSKNKSNFSIRFLNVSQRSVTGSNSASNFSHSVCSGCSELIISVTNPLIAGTKVWVR